MTDLIKQFESASTKDDFIKILSSNNFEYNNGLYSHQDLVEDDGKLAQLSPTAACLLLLEAELVTQNQTVLANISMQRIIQKVIQIFGR